MMPPTHERDTDVIAFYSSHHGEGKTIAALNFDEEHRMRTGRHKGIQVMFSINKPVDKMLSELYLTAPKMMFYKDMNKECYHGCGYTPRDFAREIRKAVDAVDPFFLINVAASRLTVYTLQEFYLIDDLTFPREYDFLRERGAKIVRIKRPDCNFIPAEEDGLLDDREFDAVIVNDGTIEELRRKVWDTCSPWIELRKLTPAEV